MRPTPGRAVMLALVAILALAGCTAPADGAASAMQVRAVAGPTCPVVSDPPDPECDDRPVEGALIVVQDEDGIEVGRMTTDVDGAAAIELAPGRYTLVPQPVEGLMGTAPPLAVTLVAGADGELLTVAYDTGIR